MVEEASKHQPRKKLPAHVASKPGVRDSVVQHTEDKAEHTGRKADVEFPIATESSAAVESDVQVVAGASVPVGQDSKRDVVKLRNEGYRQGSVMDTYKGHLQRAAQQAAKRQEMYGDIEEEVRERSESALPLHLRIDGTAQAEEEEEEEERRQAARLPTRASVDARGQGLLPVGWHAEDSADGLYHWCVCS